MLFGSIGKLRLTEKESCKTYKDCTGRFKSSYVNQKYIFYINCFIYLATMSIRIYILLYVGFCKSFACQKRLFELILGKIVASNFLLCVACSFDSLLFDK